MAKRIRVKTWGKAQPKGIRIDADATEGADIGDNLRWPDGSVVQEDEIRNTLASQSSSSTVTVVGGGGGVGGGVAVTLWELIVNIPAFISSLLSIGTGLIAKVSANAAAVRTIQGTAGQIDVANGDGVSGNPTLSLATEVSNVGLWPTIKNRIETGEAFTVPAKHQMLVWQEFLFDGGDLTLEGELVILSPGDSSLLLE